MDILGNVIFLCLFFDILMDCIHPSIAECRNLHFQQPIEDKALKGHVIRSINATSDDNCMMQCYSEERCVSYNLGPLKEDIYLCELSHSDHVLHQQDLADKKGISYRAAQNNPCHEKPCEGLKNSHICLAGFTDKGFKCQCDLSVGQVCNGCTDANWWALLDGGSVWATCVSHNEYLRGFWRSGSNHGHAVSILEQGKCCTPPTSFSNIGRICVTAGWHSLLHGQHVWAMCPDGHFLQGFHKSDGQLLSNIVEAKCCIPPEYSTSWGHCYDHDVVHSFDNEGWSTCNDDYYLVGIYKGGCDQLSCIESFRCCKMISE